MPEENTTVPVSETPNGSALQGETPTTTQTGETPERTTPPTDTAKELERLQVALKRANAEAKENRQAKEELQRLKDAELSETERLKKQYDELKTQHEEYTQSQIEKSIKHEVALEAARLGVNPKHLDKVSRLIDWEELEIDEKTGNPTNVRVVLEQLTKDMPELLTRGAVSTSGGATNPPRSQSAAPQALSWDVIGKMKPDEYAARRSEIQSWIAANPHRYGSRLK
jgi:parvulin-like peptidyl-prolyl isomerase